MNESSTINVALIDDHIVLLEGISVLLNNDARYHVCGMSTSCREGLTLIEDTRPDVVILDLSLEDGNGLELLKQIKAMHPKLPVLILSMHDENLYAERAIRAGASGYIMKGESLTKVFEAIPVVTNGGTYLSEPIRNKLIGFVSVDETDRANPLATLSDRELEIFQLIGKGKRPAHIAEQLSISVRTVETHERRICTKLNLTGMKELSEYAISFDKETWHS